jgi:hypothetical protein
MNEKDELNRLYHDAERSLMRRFLTEHEVIRVLMQAGTEEIQDWFANVIRRMTQEGDAECLGLFAMWLVLESPRDTLLNLAMWLEIQGSPDADDDLANFAGDEE